MVSDMFFLFPASDGRIYHFKNSIICPKLLTFASIKNRLSILDCNLMYEIVPVRTHKLMLMPTYFSGGVGEVIKIGRNIRWYIEESGSGAH